MAAILPSDLPAAPSVNPNAAIIVDNGAGNVNKATAAQVVDAATPLASQVEAETGADNTKRMTPLRVKQAINAQAVSLTNLASTDPGQGAGLVGFEASGADAVARDLLSKAREKVSILDFGAVADGVTPCADAFDAVQDAVGQFAEIVMPPGEYVIERTIKPRTGVIWMGYGATLKAGVNDLTFFDTDAHSYFTQFRGVRLSGLGKTGIVGFKMHHFNGTGGIFDCTGEDMDRFLILENANFGGIISNVWTARVPRPIKILSDASKLLMLNLQLDNGATQYPGWPVVPPDSPYDYSKHGTGVGVEILGGGNTIGAVLTGYIQGFEIGVIDSAFQTVIEAYFEENYEADIYGNGATASVYRNCNFIGPVGPVGVKLRNTQQVFIDNPMMSSGGRDALYDIDGTNDWTTERRLPNADSMNAPLGDLTYVGKVPAQTKGSFTPVISGSGAAGTASYTIQSGAWVWTGDRVEAMIRLAWTGHTGAGAMIVSGLPTTVPAGASARPAGAVHFSDMPVPGADRYPSFQGVGTDLTIPVIAADGSVSLAAISAAGAVDIKLSYDV